MLYKSTKNFLLTAFAFIVLIPCSIVVLGTFKTDAEIYSTPLALPKTWTLNNFRTLFDSGGLITPFKNSVIVSMSSVFITLLLASMAAYAIARSVTISGKVLFFLFTLGLAIPGQVNIIPIYVLFVKLHLNNSLIGLVLVNIALTLPISIFILSAFFKIYLVRCLRPQALTVLAIGVFSVQLPCRYVAQRWELLESSCS